MLKSLGLLVFLLFISVSSACYWANNWWKSAIVNVNPPFEMQINQGKSIQSISQDLFNARLISIDPRLFYWGWRLAMPDSTLKAGDYRLEGELTPEKIAQILATGQTQTVTVTIPEGWNMYQIAEKLEKTFAATSKSEWLTLMREQRFAKDLPGNPASVEGFLFPETYTFSKRSTPEKIITTMLQLFKKQFSGEIILEGEKLNLNPLKIVTLASIIEKETGKPEERERISSVFHNRLRIGMRLQTDPTVIYGMWERYDGNIRKDDLRTPTPYNTYVISGLPPGPIASPGLAALKAAVRPMQTEDLYFVSRGDGSHIFSKNLRDHQRNVYQFQVQPARNKTVRN